MDHSLTRICIDLCICSYTRLGQEAVLYDSIVKARNFMEKHIWLIKTTSFSK